MLRDETGESVISELFWELFLKPGASFSFTFSPIVCVWIQYEPSPSRRACVRCDSETTIFDLRYRAYRALADVATYVLPESHRVKIKLDPSGEPVLDNLRVKDYLQPGSTDLLLTVTFGPQHRPRFMNRTRCEYTKGSIIGRCETFRDVPNEDCATTQRSYVKEDTACSGSNCHDYMYTADSLIAENSSSQVLCPYSRTMRLSPVCRTPGHEDDYVSRECKDDKDDKRDIKSNMSLDIYEDIRCMPKAIDVFVLGSKVYCGPWIRTGTCTGCISSHIMPSIDELKKMGYSRYPAWYKQKIDVYHDLRDGKLKAAPVLPHPFGVRSSCAQWIYTGKCDFQESGIECLLEHNMPSPERLKFMGYDDYPYWFKKAHELKQINNLREAEFREPATHQDNQCSPNSCLSCAEPSNCLPKQLDRSTAATTYPAVPQAKYSHCHDDVYPNNALEVEYPPAFWGHRLDSISEHAKYWNVSGSPPKGPDTAIDTETEKRLLQDSQEARRTLSTGNRGQDKRYASADGQIRGSASPSLLLGPGAVLNMIDVQTTGDTPHLRSRRLQYVPPTVQDGPPSRGGSSIGLLTDEAR